MSVTLCGAICIYFLGLTSFSCEAAKVNFRRVRRELPVHNDPLFDKQRWYLSENDVENKRQNQLPSLGVEKAWGAGYTGSGVIVMVVDDGVYPDNPEIQPNMRMDLSLNILTGEHDPTPFFEVSHGTEVAGVIAASANNGHCGVGIAYDASIAGVAVPFDNATVTDEMEATALTHALSDVDIYSNSWGPPEGTYILGTVGDAAKAAIEEGASNGRNGKGAVYVWAAGNGGINNNHCAYDGYVNIRYTIPVSAIGANGFRLRTSEKCSAVMVTSYAGDGALTIPVDKVITTDDEDGNCQEHFSDTSAATPMVSGAIALALQANPSLSWLDIHYLVAASSNSDDLDQRAFNTNGAGNKVSEYLGFGLLDACKLAGMAKHWSGLSSADSCVLPIQQPIDMPGEVTLDATPCSHIVHIDHVQLTFNLTFRRGHAGFTLRSPAGTVSELLPGRFRDAYEYSFNWTVDSVAFWGEKPATGDGIWRVSIENKFPEYDNSGVLNELQLEIYGVTEEPGIPTDVDCQTKTTDSGPTTVTVSPTTHKTEPIVWKKIAIAIGVIAALALVIAIPVLLVKYCKKNKNHSPNAASVELNEQKQPMKEHV